MDASSSHTLTWPTLIALLMIFPPMLLLIIIFQSRFSSGRATKLPPGPSPLPVIGNLLHVGRQPHRSLQQLSRKHGDIMYLRLGRVPALVISSADMAEKVLKTHDVDLCSRPRTVVSKKLTYNFLDVAFSPYGDNWRQMRKVCTMELFSSKSVQSTRVIREEEVARVMKEIARAASKSSNHHMRKVNLTDMVFGIAQGIISKVALGTNWSIESGPGNKLLEPIKLADTLMGGTFLADYLPWAGWVDAIRGLKQKLDACFIGISDYFDEVIDDHLRLKTADQKVVDHGEDFLDVMLRMEKNSGLTRNHIKAVLMDIFMAGIDTVSCTMIWAMSELLRNRRVMEKAQEEVRKIAGSKGKVEDGDLKEMQYLKAVVKEVLRLHPPGPLLVPREAIRESTIDGYDIPPRARVFVNVFSIGRDHRYWKNPLEFSPERFLDGSSIDFKGTHYEFLPFGAGRRICPGMELGMAIAELSLANLLYCFDWALPLGMNEEDIDMSEGDSITLCKKTPLVAVPHPFHRQ